MNNYKNCIRTYCKYCNVITQILNLQIQRRNQNLYLLLQTSVFRHTNMSFLKTEMQRFMILGWTVYLHCVEIKTFDYAFCNSIQLTLVYSESITTTYCMLNRAVSESPIKIQIYRSPFTHTYNMPETNLCVNKKWTKQE